LLAYFLLIVAIILVSTNYYNVLGEIGATREELEVVRCAD